ncbi:MAG: hypothetical protein HKN00_11560 [Flavobacteriaceae bacterium]|nr:WbqC family protein [Bacteroidia bacterium]MBT8287003.1 WbqC family protein [Bacteroidia bacterium]NNF75816.1 hypothetical protein [Flavobacteriaceae bacterium]NNK71649.1 hypothetical protein [Flavobacteriaceae bacterium]
MKLIVYPAYFPNIWTYASMLQASDVCLEIHGNYQKQTYRNRTAIYGANGRINLTVPVHFTHHNRQLYRDIKISQSENWQANHWKSIKSAYSSSPFFEYYEDMIEPFFQNSFSYMQDLSIASMELLNTLLGIELNWTYSSNFESSPEPRDFRFLIKSRQERIPDLKPYIQVFSAKHGFINNLSTLDLLFNEGPAAKNYLLSQDVDLLVG